MVVAPLLLEKLGEMVLAVEDAFQSRVVGRREGAASMRAFEAGLVVGLLFNSHLLKRVCCFTTSGALVLCSRKHARSFAWRSGQLRSQLLRRRFRG